jgi:hypothetical protein
MSCASCHNDGGHDGRVWDLTGFGEGLRNTISLRGRAGGQGFLHWSNNFDEVQDFEKQIRDLAGGTGLMTSAEFGTGTRSQPSRRQESRHQARPRRARGLRELADALRPSPYRSADGSTDAPAGAGRTLFESKNCGSLPWRHRLHEQRQQQSAGRRHHHCRRAASASVATLTGIDIPTLRDVWATAPYLHLARRRRLGDAIRRTTGCAHDPRLVDLVAYLQQIGTRRRTLLPPPPPALHRRTPGTGLAGQLLQQQDADRQPRATAH